MEQTILKQNPKVRYFWIPIICFRNWTFSQFYTYYYLSKHRNSKNFVRINNFIGRKKDPMKINRSTYFSARKYLEELGAIRVIHPKQGINSGSKTDAYLNSSFLKFEKNIATLPITHEFLETISDKKSWKEARLTILKFYFENFWVGETISFNRWLSRDVFCPFTEKTIKGKSSNYSTVKKIESEKWDWSNIIFNHKVYLGKNKKTSTKPDCINEKNNQIQQNSTSSHRQNRTVKVSSKLFIVKQVNGVGEVSSKPISNYTFYDGEYELLKTGFSRVIEADSLPNFSEDEKHLLMAFTSLCRNKLQSLSDSLSIFDLIRIVIGNYFCIKNSNIATKTNFTNRLLKSIEFNFSVGIFNEFISVIRENTSSDNNEQESKFFHPQLQSDSPLQIPQEEVREVLYKRYRNRVGEVFYDGFSSLSFSERSVFFDKIWDKISELGTEGDIIKFLSATNEFQYEETISSQMKLKSVDLQSPIPGCEPCELINSELLQASCSMAEFPSDIFNISEGNPSPHS